METYNRKAVGQRIREKRKQYGMTMARAAQMLGRVPKYYADIERGNCGMSLDTMLSISRFYHISLDYLILGRENLTGDMKMSDGEDALGCDEIQNESDIGEVFSLLMSLTERDRKYALDVLRTFLAACGADDGSRISV